MQLRPGFAKDGEYFDREAEQYNDRGNSDPGRAVHFFGVELCRIFAFSAAHEEHANTDNNNPNQDPGIIFFSEKTGTVRCVYLLFFVHYPVIWPAI